jgi:hypothetical protein
MDAYSRPAAWAKNAAKLHQPQPGIRKELQAQLANDRAEAAILEGQRLTIGSDRRE